MPAALFTININVAVGETYGTNVLSPVLLPVSLTGNHIEKINVDVPANSSLDISVPFPVNEGLHFIGMATTGANITFTATNDDDSTTPVTLVKGQPILYYPGGTTAAPFTKRVRKVTLANADLVKSAVFHMRILRDCKVLGDEDD